MGEPKGYLLPKSERPLLLAVFLDLLGFGMLIADIQLRAEHMTPYGWPTGLVIGILLASTFIIQWFVSPRWGRVSDRTGRKPIIVVCTLLSAAAMLTYGLAPSLVFLALSRVLAGFGAANVAVSQAYISTKLAGPDQTAALGRIGAAISAGLVLGPPVGGFLAVFGERSALSHGLPGQFFVGVVAGLCSLVGAVVVGVWVARDLGLESADLGEGNAKSPRSLLRDFPELIPLVIMIGSAWFSLATLEGTFARLIEKLFGYGPLQFGTIFGYESLLGIAIQGLVLASILKRMKELSLVRLGYFGQGIGLGLNPFASILAPSIIPMVTLVVASTLYALGAAVSNPTMNAVCSRQVPANRQGELFGLLQGTRSFGFVVGPLLGGLLFDWKASAPYYLAGAVCVIVALVFPSVVKEAVVT